MHVADFYSACVGETLEFLEGARRKIEDAHCGMGLVRNVNSILYRSISDDQDATKVSNELRGEIERQSRRSIEAASEIIPEGAVVATLSDSSAVRGALEAYGQRIGKLYVMESRPGNEGISMASFAGSLGIDTILVVDAAIREITEKCTMALVGSDSVLSDNSLIHKIGTYPLFLSMKSAGKDSYSLTIDLKREERFTFENYPDFLDHGPSEITGSNIPVRNVYYDITPPQLVSYFISDRGIIPA